MNRDTNARRVFAAGMAGGLAEVAWVTLYRGTGGAAEVARQVTGTVIPGGGVASNAGITGLSIHLFLSWLLALAYWRLVQPRLASLPKGTRFVVAAAVLAIIWTVNFQVLLPLLNPAFTLLMPAGVTLASKILFGLAMAGVLEAASPARTASIVSDHRHTR